MGTNTNSLTYGDIKYEDVKKELQSKNAENYEMQIRRMGISSTFDLIDGEYNYTKDASRYIVENELDKDYMEKLEGIYKRVYNGGEFTKEDYKLIKKNMNKKIKAIGLIDTVKRNNHISTKEQDTKVKDYKKGITEIEYGGRDTWETYITYKVVKYVILKISNEYYEDDKNYGRDGSLVGGILGGLIGGITTSGALLAGYDYGMVFPTTVTVGIGSGLMFKYGIKDKIKNTKVNKYVGIYKDHQEEKTKVYQKKLDLYNYNIISRIRNLDDVFIAVTKYTAIGELELKVLLAGILQLSDYIEDASYINNRWYTDGLKVTYLLKELKKGLRLKEECLNPDEVTMTKDTVEPVEEESLKILV